MRVVGAARQGRTKTSKTLIPLLVPEFAVTDISKTAQTTTFSVLFAVSFCHLVNDIMSNFSKDGRLDGGTGTTAMCKLADGAGKCPMANAVVISSMQKVLLE